METPEDFVARNVADLRDRRRLTVRALSMQLDELGRKILPSGITKVESRARGVDVGELVALAVALGVNPNRLLLPASAGDNPVHLTPTKEVAEWQAWQWADGRFPLPTRSGDDEEFPYNTDDELEDFQLHARPAELRAGENHTAMKAAQAVAGRLRRLLALSPDERAGGVPAAKVRADALRRAMARLNAEIDDLLDGADGER